MNNIEVINIFAAVFDKKSLDPLLDAILVFSSLKPGFEVSFWGTYGTMDYVGEKGFRAESVIRGFDFDGRVKSLDRANFVRILADSAKQNHLDELKREGLEPFDLVVVDLYAPDPKIFPESMDIGGQALIRAAIKNFKNVALAFDKQSIDDLVAELKINGGSTTLVFRKRQAKAAAKFIAGRTKLEAEMFEKV